MAKPTGTKAAKSEPAGQHTSAQEATNGTGGGTGSAIVPMTAQMPSHSAEFMAQMAEQAKQTSAAERPQQSKLSIKGGILAYAGNPMPDNEMECVVIGSAYVNTFYIDPYNPNKIVSPRCFALALPVFRDGVYKEPDMEAHENVLVEEGVLQQPGLACKDCPNHEWGSDPSGGRGKACKEKRRIVLMPAAALENEDDIANAELATIDIPVMSVGNWATYVNKLAATTGLPYHAVVTKLKVVNDPRSQYKVTFEGVGKISSEAVIRAVMKRQEEANKLLLVPFDTYGASEEEPADSKAPAKKRKF